MGMVQQFDCFRFLFSIFVVHFSEKNHHLFSSSRFAKSHTEREEDNMSDLYQEAIEHTALVLGIDIIELAKPTIFDIVEEALHAPPPAPWVEKFDDLASISYFYNPSTNQTSYDNPVLLDPLLASNIAHARKVHVTVDSEVDAVDVEKEDDYIEHILDRRLDRTVTIKGKKQMKYEYKVHWHGTSSNEDEWFLGESMTDAYCQELIRQYDQQQDERRHKRPKKEEEVAKEEFVKLHVAKEYNIGEYMAKSHSVTDVADVAIQTKPTIQPPIIRKQENEISRMKQLLKEKDLHISHLIAAIDDIQYDNTALHRTMELTMKRSFSVQDQLKEISFDNTVLRHRLNDQNDAGRQEKEDRWKQNVFQLLKDVDVKKTNKRRDQGEHDATKEEKRRRRRRKRRQRKKKKEQERLRMEKSESSGSESSGNSSNISSGSGTSSGSGSSGSGRKSRPRMKAKVRLVNKVSSSGRIHPASRLVTTPANVDGSTLHASPSLALQHLDSPDRATLSKLYDTVAIQCCPLLLSPEFL